MNATVTIEDDVTPDEAHAALAQLFAEAGSYFVKAPGGDVRLVTLSAPAELAADPMTLWGEFFPTPGTYFVKAAGVGGGKPFDVWFYERLAKEALDNGGRLRDFIRRIVEDYIRTHGGDLSNPVLLEQFERLLFDLRQAIRWSMELPIDPAAAARLRGLGLTERELLDVPGIAYRFGRIDETLRTHGRTWSWATALSEAAQLPLDVADHAAMAYARERTATYLTPVLLREATGARVAALEAEQRMLRTMTADAVRTAMHPREFARQLYKQFAPEGLWRDWDRVARTEIQEARLRGSWTADSQARGWTGATLIYRNLGTNPCSGCLLLHRNPDGFPKLYRVAEVEAADAQGPNRGPWRAWHPRIGPTHPQCRCSPWATYVPALQPAFERFAPKWAAEYASRRTLTENESP